MSTPAEGSTDRPDSPTTKDTAAPPSWLDDIEGERALEWVRERDDETTGRLGGPRFEELRTRIREVLDAPGRIPMVAVRGTWAYNFWTDADHPRGLWRRQPLTGYLAGAEDWEVLIDVDELSRTEGRSWVWHGARVLYPDRDRALVDLSEGGSDADVTREFDIEARRWVDGGFARAESKGSMSWIDRDTVWLSTDFGQGTTSSSGYPLQARLLRRGASPAEAPVIVEGGPEDMATGAVHDHTPGYERSWANTAHDFYHSTTHLLEGDPTDPGSTLVPVRIDVPLDADVEGWRDWLLVFLHGDWDLEGRTWPAGTLLVFGLERFLAGARRAEALFVPDGHAFLQGFTATRHHVVLETTVDVVSSIRVATPPSSVAGDGAGDGTVDEDGSAAAAGGEGGAGGGTETVDDGGAGAATDAGAPAGQWTVRDLDLSGTDVPPLSTITARAVDPLEDDRLWLTVTGFTTPTSLYLVDLDPHDAGVTSSQLVRSAPTLFDATGVEASQHFATSADGTRVPYFQVGRPGGNPAAPTLLYGYGGFEVSLQPGYSAGVGRALLERGGTYVVANIRGGGEYGPAWHRAALTRNRPRAYEDFEAVARDLVARGVTTPSRLGIQGGSNGGLLTGNMLSRAPELFGAVVIQSPLLDMRRYHTLLAGASWMAEYGDPDDPEQWEFIRGVSPLHLWDAQRAHPPVLITTSTRDDRVHPAHARTMAWRMREDLADVVYYENIEGGHAGAADNAQRAFMAALVWEFLWQSLGD